LGRGKEKRERRSEDGRWRRVGGCRKVGRVRIEG
jgi:hypothetical protein